MSPQETNTAPQSGPSHADSQPPKQRRSVWPFLVAGILVLAFVGVVLWRILGPSPVVTTDDARVAAHYTIVAPRVSGQVMAVHVDDNEHAKAGQILVQLDPRDLETAVRNAQAALQETRLASVTYLRQLSANHRWCGRRRVGSRLLKPA